MTTEQLLAEVERVPGGWFVNTAGALRRRDDSDEGWECPIVAVARRHGIARLDPNRFAIAAAWLGLPIAEAQDIANAADAPKHARRASIARACSRSGMRAV